jgi:hypothetical protein
MCEKEAIGGKNRASKTESHPKDNPRCSRPLRRPQVAQHTRGAFKPRRRHSPGVIAPTHEGVALAHVSSGLMIEFATRPSTL